MGPTPHVALPAPGALSVPDRWILSRLAAVTAETDQLFEQFEFGKACDALYHFAWDEFCDWYLELAKLALSGDDAAAAAAARAVLGHVLDRLLRLIHPVMPFVTDELWTHLTGGDSVMTAAWPGQPAPGASGLEPLPRDPAAEAEIGALMRPGHPGAPVPLRPGPAPGAARARGPGRDWDHRAGRPRGGDPGPAAPRRPWRRVRAHGIGGGRGGHRAAGHRGRDRRGRRAAAAGEGSLRSPGPTSRRPNASSPTSPSSSGPPPPWWRRTGSGCRAAQEEIARLEGRSPPCPADRLGPARHSAGPPWGCFCACYGGSFLHHSDSDAKLGLFGMLPLCDSAVGNWTVTIPESLPR